MCQRFTGPKLALEVPLRKGGAASPESGEVDPSVCALANSWAGLLRPCEELGWNGNVDTTKEQDGILKHPGQHSELDPSMD